MSDPTADSLARQRETIKRAETVLRADDRILAAYLVGSHAAGNADAYSDVDLHVIVRDDDFAACLAESDQLLTDIGGPLVLVDTIPGVTGVLAVTRDWLHIDLLFHPETEYDPNDYDAVAPLFDRTDHLRPETPHTALFDAGEPYYPELVVNLFFYFLGNLVIVLGRGELIVAHSGIVAVKGPLIDLMCAERGVERFGGAKRLNPFLSDEQRAVLEAVPAAGADREQIIAAHRYLCAQFIERGQRLAETTGNHWPQELQDATLAHLRRHLGVDFAPGAVER